MSKNREMVLGALVGDAASLGLHWLYDQPRIAELGGTNPEFCATTAQDFHGVPRYFAHPLKRPGDMSQYGEQVIVLLQALAATDGAYDQATYNAKFVAHFGYGGTYSGYIDHATRETLDNLADAKDDQPNGAQDTQLPAIAKLPALIAAGQESHAAAAICSTNDTDIALSFGRVATAMLVIARDGGTISDVVDSALDVAYPTIKPSLEKACSDTRRSNQELTADIGMACELAMCFPAYSTT